MSREQFEKTKRYKSFMKDNWSQLLYNEYYNELSAAQKAKVHKGIKNDKKHNKKDAKKIKRGN